MTATTRLFLVLGSILAALAVISGAMGAHALREEIGPEKLHIFQTAAQYHFYHALGLFGVAFVAHCLPHSRLALWAGWVMILGILLFSGSLYLLSLTGMTMLGAVTPFGGMAFILSWFMLAFAAYKI
ncbi:MAG TPA: DUF423 domain-containing protein [Chromatiales bacterium]|nr:DUF423 domain-containing protein [Chromatiales bacterium]